jgi:hypothetical protein
VLGYDVFPVAPDGGNALAIRDETPGTPEEKHSGFLQAICGLYGHEGTLLMHGRISASDMDGKGWISVMVLEPSGTSDFTVSEAITGSTPWIEFTSEIPIEKDVGGVLIEINLNGSGTFYVDYLEASFSD